MPTHTGGSSPPGKGVPITVLFDPKLIRAWIDTGVAPAELVKAGNLVTSQNLPLSPVHPRSVHGARSRRRCGKPAARRAAVESSGGGGVREATREPAVLAELKCKEFR
jgi:hypothetical protein